MEFLKRYKIFLLSAFFLISVLAASCEQLVLGPEPNNDPQTNFNILWEDFDSYYSLFELRRADWNEQYNLYSQKINKNTDDEELWSYMREMLEKLNDPHVALQAYFRYFQSGTPNRFYKGDFEWNVIRNNYLGGSLGSLSGNGFLYGKILNHDIGYLRITSFEPMDGNWFYLTDSIIKELNQYVSLIIDIRNNAGGEQAVQEYVASAFVTSYTPYLIERFRSGKNHNEFGPPNTVFASPRTGSVQYTKPVVILTNRGTFSASDQFNWLFKKYIPGSKQIGDTTKGGFCPRTPVRQLPNGWQYSFSAGLVTSLDGVTLDSLNGIAPDILVLNARKDLLKGVDSVMERSIRYLEQGNEKSMFKQHPD